LLTDANTSYLAQYERAEAEKARIEDRIDAYIRDGLKYEDSRKGAIAEMIQGGDDEDALVEILNDLAQGERPTPAIRALIERHLREEAERLEW